MNLYVLVLNKNVIFYSNGVNEEVMKNFSRNKFFAILIIVFVIVLYPIQLKNNSFLKSSKMIYARAGHSSIILEDKILFVGGDKSDSAKTAELYDLKLNKIVKTYNLNFTHTLPNIFKNSKGEIIIIDNNSIELINLNEKQAKLIQTQPFKLDCYVNTTKTIQLDDGTVLITGGLENGTYKLVNNNFKILTTGLPSKKAYIYDINNFKIIKTLNMNYAHSEHSVIKLDNGNVLIFGGNSLSKEGALSIEIFDNVNKKFNIVGHLNFPRRNMLIAKQNNLIFLIAGQSFYKEQWGEHYIKANSNNIIEIYDISKKSMIDLSTELINKYGNYNIDNKNSLVTNLDNKYLLFFISQRNNKSKIIIYDTNCNKIIKSKTVNVGLYPSININNAIIISGGEKRINKLSLLMLSNLCVYGKICTYKDSKKIKIMKGFKL